MSLSTIYHRLLSFFHTRGSRSKRQDITIQPVGQRSKDLEQEVTPLTQAEPAMEGPGNAADSSTTQNSFTKFFELPYELRDAIYEYLLPPNSKIHYIGGPLPSGTFHIEDTWISNMCQADPRFNPDLERIEQVRPICRFIVSPDGCDIPHDFDINKYKRLEIFFEHYHLATPGVRGHHIAFSHSLMTMSNNFRRFVNRIKTHERLPEIHVSFRDEPRLGLYGDRHWTHELQQGGQFTQVPILRLPLAKTATIQPITCLIASGHNGPFDSFPNIENLSGRWMVALCSALSSWLEGEREQPFEDLLNQRSSGPGRLALAYL